MMVVFWLDGLLQSRLKPQEESKAVKWFRDSVDCLKKQMPNSCSFHSQVISPQVNGSGDSLVFFRESDLASKIK